MLRLLFGSFLCGAGALDPGIKALPEAPEGRNVLRVRLCGPFFRGCPLWAPSGFQVPFQPPPVVILNLNCALRFAVLFAVHTAFGTAFLRASEADNAERLRFFESRIRPVLVERCEGCHSADAQQKGKLKAGFFADSRKGLLEGGDSGPAVVAGKPAESLLLRAMQHESKDIAMPPKEEKLPKSVLDDFARWIADGAVDPREAVAGIAAKKRGLSLEQGRAFWSMRPPLRPAVPAVGDAGWALSAVDRFLLAAMEREGLKPAGEAPAEAVLRRVYLDVTGLAPAAEAVASFRMEDLEAEVDRLLKSDAFGERWGRHWLDVARYAESNGKDRNVIFHHAWRYRDYVFDAFASDMPFDVFLREQVAGDLLASAQPERRDALRVATGFLALGSKAYEETKPEVFRMDVIDEQIEVLGRGVLGLSVACARCHDHKFEAIPTADYYALAGVLRSTALLYGYGPRGIKATAFHHTELHAVGAEADGREAQGLAYLRRLDEEMLAMHTSRSDRYRVQRRVPDAKRKLETAAGDEKTQAECELEALNREIDEWHAKVGALEKSVTQLQDSAPPMPGWAMGAREREQPEDCRIHIRGETALLGDKVPRGFLRVLDAPRVSAPGPGRSGRLELAEWLTHRDNPLTARVYVNRVWSHLFGRGLVTTPDDFGVTGAAPSHPELLDHLAVEFMDHGWSTKWLVRSLVLSRAYRMDSVGTAGSRERDPDNRWVARMRPRAADAEVIHDSMLAAAGLLDRSRPKEPFFAAFHAYRDEELFSFKPFVTKAKLLSNHRAVYLPVIRGVLPEVLELFEFASPDRPVAERNSSILPTQALYLMNNPRVTELAVATARRSAGAGDRSGGSAGRVTWLFRTVLGRTPRAHEVERVLGFVDAQTGGSGQGGGSDATVGQGVEERWADFCQMLFASVEHRLIR